MQPWRRIKREGTSQKGPWVQAEEDGGEEKGTKRTSLAACVYPWGEEEGKFWNGGSQCLRFCLCRKPLRPSHSPPGLMISTANWAGSVMGPRGWCCVDCGPAPHLHAPGQAPMIPVCIFQAAQPLHIQQSLENKKRHVPCLRLAHTLPLGSPSGFYDK